MKFKAIDTNYKGYKFRSRLEARWAIYFDSVGLKWEYEKEGFEFEDGIKYLPDFWLPEVEMWAEVKHNDYFDWEDEEKKKVEYLVKSTKNPCILLCGVPELKPYDCLVIPDNPNEPLLVNGLDIYDLMISNYHNYPHDEKRFYSCVGEYDGTEDSLINTFEDSYNASISAKSARFEFKRGEGNESN